MASFVERWEWCRVGPRKRRKWKTRETQSIDGAVLLKIMEVNSIASPLMANARKDGASPISPFCRERLRWSMTSPPALSSPCSLTLCCSEWAEESWAWSIGGTNHSLPIDEASRGREQWSYQFFHNLANSVPACRVVHRFAFVLVEINAFGLQRKGCKLCFHKLITLNFQPWPHLWFSSNAWWLPWRRRLAWWRGNNNLLRFSYWFYCTSRYHRQLSWHCSYRRMATRR